MIRRWCQSNGTIYKKDFFRRCMSMKLIKLLFAMILTVGVLFGCDSTNVEPNNSATEQAEVQVEIIISVENGEDIIATEELAIESGTNLMTLMEDNFEVVNDGGFISSINGIEAEDGQTYAWLYTINGEHAMTGAEDYIIEDGDVIEFDFHSWE